MREGFYTPNGYTALKRKRQKRRRSRETELELLEQAEREGRIQNLTHLAEQARERELQRIEAIARGEVIDMEVWRVMPVDDPEWAVTAPRGVRWK